MKFRLKKPKALALALALAVSAAAAAYAQEPPARAGKDGEGPGTDVWLAVVPRSSAERISVEVPVALAFVVNGTADRQNSEAISAENGSLLLPNVKVTEQDGGYSLTVEGEASFVVRNYSTNVRAEDLDQENPPRCGVRVELTGTIQDQQAEETPPADPAQRKNWLLTGAQPSAAAEGYKQYRVSLDGHPFSVEAGERAFAMDGPITVGAPPAQQHGWTAAGTSNVPFEQEVAVSVEVGGTRGMYRAAEASAKAANIVWSVKTLPLEP